MARTDLVVTVHLCKEVKDFIDLYEDTLGIVNDFVTLVHKNPSLLVFKECQDILNKVNEVILRSEQVDYGKS